MPDSIENQLTYAVSYLEMRFGELNLASGSGFFWKHNGQPFLVTNWHNASGRNPSTGKPIDEKSAAIPDRIAFTVYWSAASAVEGYSNLTPQAMSVPLYNDDGTHRWLEHPIHGSKVDVVLVPLVGFPEENLCIRFANEFLPDIKREPTVSQDAFVVGYPLGLLPGGYPIPVWKRATIATEPTVDIDGLPKLLVDTATRQGMSGSLVLAKHHIHGAYELADGQQQNNLVTLRDTILGVYSGRLGRNEVEAQLGVVWKKRVIAEILEGVQ